MKYRVEISPRAHSDVFRNTEWWATHHSIEQADSWQEAVYSKMRSLNDFPESHPLADENPSYQYDLREAHFGLGSRPGYRILFTITDDTVAVLSVRAAEEDWIRPDELP